MMNRSKSSVITISRQIGSGGAYIGKKLAQKLDIYYADREILNKAAQQLSVLERDIEQREEKLQSFWETYFQMSRYATDVFLNPILIQPNSLDLFNAEAEIIRRLATEQPAVIIGRCGFHILRDLPNKVSIFLHANVDFRKNRIQEVFNVSEKEALEMITRVDKERAQFIEEYTGKKWNDARLFDLCIDTGILGVDKSVDLLINYLESI